MTKCPGQQKIAQIAARQVRKGLVKPILTRHTSRCANCAELLEDLFYADLAMKKAGSRFNRIAA